METATLKFSVYDYNQTNHKSKEQWPPSVVGTVLRMKSLPISLNSLRHKNRVDMGITPGV